MRRKLNTILKGRDLGGIVKLEEVFEERGEILLVLELMQGDLNKKEINEHEVVFILKDVLASLKEIHKKGIVHFDIRPGRNY